MIVTDRDELVARGAAVTESPDLTTLADRLARRLEPWLGRDLYLPDQKARLTADGGVCAEDGARLIFDPRSPHEHQCPQCGARLRGDRHHQAWVWRYHLWLSERAVHGALLAGLGRQPAGGQFAAQVLRAYAARYRDFPNRDNVLGPTRLFFSTYLESIWLLQIVIAAGLLEMVDLHPSGDRVVVQGMVEESADLIASFEEGWSNRQVWNGAALIAAGRYLDKKEMLDRGRDGAHGVLAILGHGVSDGGRWHEGENYHLFALRGFLLAAELLRVEGVSPYHLSPFGRRLSAMYEAPLDTADPDLVLAARGDSPFGVSLRQRRFADLWEVGWSRTRSPRLAAVLRELYVGHAVEDETAGSDIAEVEQNQPARPLSRGDLGWKSLLWMHAETPPAENGDWGFVGGVVDDRGPVVCRTTAADRVVLLETHGTGSGHGHPDALHLSIWCSRPWLVDMGTGSYVSPSLFWYRSHLAHNAPGIAGIGQWGWRGWCTHYDQQGPWAWARVVAELPGSPGDRIARTVVVGPTVVIDTVDCDVAPDVTIDLPIHPLGALEYPDHAPADAQFFPPKVQGVAHGYDAVSAIRRISGPAETITVLDDDRSWKLSLAPRAGETVFVGRGPGPPGLYLGDGGATDFVVRRATGEGRWVQAFSTHGVGLDVTTDAIEVASLGETAIVRMRLDGVEIIDSAQRQTLLGGARPRPPAPATGPAPAPEHTLTGLRVDRVPTIDEFFDRVLAHDTVLLGERDYRRAENAYPGVDAFAARIGFAFRGATMYIGVSVRKATLVFRRSTDPDPHLDNESPDIHSDGVQLYVESEGWKGYVAIPEPPGSAVRIRPVDSTVARDDEVQGIWAPTDEGYIVLLAFRRDRTFDSGEVVRANVVVNEMSEGRERRAGQLALAGAGGGTQWVFLRGDREAPTATVAVRVR